MGLYWSAVSFNVMARTPPLHHAGLSGRGLSVQAITRRCQAEQPPEPWFVAGSLDGQALVPHQRPVVPLSCSGGHLCIQPPPACSTTSIAVRWISFFCIIYSTGRKMVITPEFTGMGRSLVVRGSSEFWSTEEAICLDIDRAQ